MLSQLNVVETWRTSLVWDVWLKLCPAAEGRGDAVVHGAKAQAGPESIFGFTSAYPLAEQLNRLATFFEGGRDGRSNTSFSGSIRIKASVFNVFFSGCINALHLFPMLSRSAFIKSIRANHSTKQVVCGRLHQKLHWKLKCKAASCV